MKGYAVMDFNKNKIKFYVYGHFYFANLNVSFLLYFVEVCVNLVSRVIFILCISFV
jgi:hypothetical protein